MRYTDFKIINESKEPDIIQALRDFLPIAIAELGLKRLPTIKFMSHLENTDQPTFGRFSHDGKDALIQLGIVNRHPVDVLRTLAHELVHYKQFVNKQLGKNSGDTGSPAENEAHVIAGIIMRHFDKKHPEYLKSSNISDEKMPSEFNEGKVAPNAKYKKLADALEDYANKHIPKSQPGFGDFMYHAELIRKGHTDVHKQDLSTVQKKYHTVMTDLIKKHLNENFKDGKNPGRKGLAKRSGVNTKASVSSLRKTAKNSSGEKQRMAHWLANMKSGRQTKTTNEAIAPHGSPEHEFELMQAGSKPAALVSPLDFKKLYKKTAEANNWPHFQLDIPGAKYSNFVVGQPGQESRIQRIAKIVTDMNVNMKQGIKPGKDYHIELGRLLGYSDSDIRDFLQKINLEEEYKDADYARGGVKMPAAKPGRKKHPLHGKLVGGQ